MKTRKTWIALAAVATLLTGVRAASGANIVWVSDYNDPSTGFFPAGSGFTDSGFVTLLQNAGHNVIRYNQPNAQATLLTQAELDALNTNDLIIISRAVNSGVFQPVQGNQWNVNITKPLMDLSPFHVRTDGPNRLGWFSGNTSDAADDTTTTLTATDPINPVTDYLFAGVAMAGLSTAVPYNESLDRNGSHVPGEVVNGGVVYATATFVPQNGAPPTMTTAKAIAGFPAGTLVRGGSEALGGYRMYFSAGSREGTTFPIAIPLYTCRENLTSTGEDIFLRAVRVALNNGAPPASDPNAPVDVTSQPAGVTILQGRPVTFSVSVTGAAPRSLQWQRDIGDGVTFTNIPDASTTFSRSSYTISGVSNEDNGARFRVVVSNPVNTVNSDLAILTVTPDRTPPVLLGAASVDGLTIGVCFDEVLETVGDAVIDPFSYSVDGGAQLVSSVALRPDGKSVILSFAVPPDPPLGSTFTLKVTSLSDPYGNILPPEGVTVNGTNRGLLNASVGPPNPIGETFACLPDSFDVSGGGLDIQATAEQFQFAYLAKDGDFDAHVRVNSIVGSTRMESVAKALLSVRATADGASPGVNVFVTTPTPGDSSYGATARLVAGGATVSNVAAVAYSPGSIPATFPAWLRIRRAGDAFTTFRSADGVVWTEIGTVTVALGPTALVGVATSSHRNGILATANFSNFQVSSAVSQPTLTNPLYSSGSFSASLATQVGVSYNVEYKNAIDTPLWTPLTTLNGDGMTQTFSDPGPVSPTGNRFYQIRIP